MPLELQNQRPVGVRIWDRLQTALAHEQSPFLSIDKFVLQKDAYVRLSDDDVASDVPWLSYTMDSVTSDTDLDFAFHLFAEGISFHFGPASFEASYLGFCSSQTDLMTIRPDADPVPDPDKVVGNLILTIKLLLNGQIAVGCSLHDGQIIAVETFLSGYDRRPLTIGLVSQFGLFRRTATDYTIKQNRIIGGRIKIPSDFPLLPPVVDGHIIESGRSVEVIDDLKPLSKKLVDRIENSRTLQQFGGKKPEQSDWQYFYSKTEFWFALIAYAGLVFAVRSLPYMPAYLGHEGPFIVYAAAGWFAVPLVTGILLYRRQSLINMGRRPLSLRLEQALAKVFRRTSER